MKLFFLTRSYGNKDLLMALENYNDLENYQKESVMKYMHVNVCIFI